MSGECRSRMLRSAKTAEIVRESPITLARAKRLPPSLSLFLSLPLGLLDGDGEVEKQNRRTGCWGLIGSESSSLFSQLRVGSALLLLFGPRLISIVTLRVCARVLDFLDIVVCVTRERGRTDVPLRLHFHPPSFLSVLVFLPLSPSMA